MNILDCFDPSKYFLGNLCRRKHDFRESGKSLRYRSQTACARCEWERDRPRVRNKNLQFDPRSPEQKLQQLSDRQKDFDEQKYCLGPICVHGHDWRESGFSLRHKGSGGCLECSAIRRKQFHQDNPGKQAEYTRAFYLRHPEKLADLSLRSKEWERRNRSRKTATTREWRKNHPEQYRAQKKRHRLRHPEQNAIHVSRRRAARKRAHSAPYSKEQLQGRALLFSNLCAYCQSKKFVHWDHFIALSKGGTDTFNNLVPACFSCNCSKHSADPYEWYKKQPFFTEKRWNKIVKALGKSDGNYNQLPLL